MKPLLAVRPKCMLRSTPFLLCLAASPLMVLASEEDFVPWQSVTVKSTELPGVGIVAVEASTSGDTYKVFVLSAFDRSHSLTASQLKRLQGFALSSMTITHEAGYAQFGGHTVHVRFQRTYTDRTPKLVRDCFHFATQRCRTANIRV